MRLRPPVLDVIKNDLQVLGALLARLARPGPRLIGHQAHRFDDAAAFLIDRFIVLAHERQKRVKLRRGSSALQSHLPYLRAQQLVQVRVIVSRRERIR